MSVLKITINAMAKIAKAVYINGNTSLILASTMLGMSNPVMTMTAVPINELKLPPI